MYGSQIQADLNVLRSLSRVFSVFSKNFGSIGSVKAPLLKLHQHLKATVSGFRSPLPSQCL
jgi:hypothetical protein